MNATIDSIIPPSLTRPETEGPVWGIACGITIVPNLEGFAVIKGRMTMVLNALFHKWFYDPLEAQSLLAYLELNEKPEARVSFVWFASECCMVFQVSDWRRGFAVVKERLAALQLLESARISYRDYAEGIWRPLHPKDGPAFDPREFLNRLPKNSRRPHEKRLCNAI